MRHRLAAPEVIRQNTGEYLDDACSSFRNTFNDAQISDGCAKPYDQEYRQQRMDHLGRDVHEETGQTESPHCAGQSRWRSHGSGCPVRGPLQICMALVSNRARIRTRLPRGIPTDSCSAVQTLANAAAAARAARLSSRIWPFSKAS